MHYVFLIFCFVFLSDPWANSKVEFERDGEIPLLPNGEYCIDSTRTLTLVQIKSPLQSCFKPIHSHKLNLGYMQGTLWVRFFIEASLLRTHENLLIDLGHPSLQNATLYFPKGKVFDSMIIGPRGPMNSEDRWERQMIYRVNPMMNPGVYYQKIETNGLLQLSTRLVTLERLSQEREGQRLFQGFSFGFLGIMVILNLIWLIYSFVSRDYILYILFLFCNALFLFFDSDLPFALAVPLSQSTLQVIDLTLAGLLIFLALQFAGAFLQLETHFLWLQRSFNLLSSAVIGTLVYFWFSVDLSHIARILANSALFLPPLFIFATLLCWNKGIRGIGIFFLAWTSLGIGTVIYVLAFLGYLPQNFLTTHAYQLAVIGESTLLSIVMSQRLSTLMIEHEYLVHSEEDYKEKAERDQLTGLYNRRFLEKTLESQYLQCKAQNLPLSLIMIDVDHFKRVNDTFGHAVGDVVLRKLGSLIPSMLRKQDIACRYGGEEFTLVLPGADLETAMAVGERIRTAFAKLSFDNGRTGDFSATLSVGIALLQENEKPHECKVRADKALYAAKEEGRNRCVIANV